MSVAMTELMPVKIVHVIHQHHETTPSQHQKYIYNKITDGKINDRGINRTLVKLYG